MPNLISLSFQFERGDDGSAENLDRSYNGFRTSREKSPIKHNNFHLAHRHLGKRPEKSRTNSVYQQRVLVPNPNNTISIQVRECSKK